MNTNDTNDSWPRKTSWNNDEKSWWSWLVTNWSWWSWLIGCPLKLKQFAKRIGSIGGYIRLLYASVRAYSWQIERLEIAIETHGMETCIVKTTQTVATQVTTWIVKGGHLSTIQTDTWGKLWGTATTARCQRKLQPHEDVKHVKRYSS